MPSLAQGKILAEASARSPARLPAQTQHPQGTRGAAPQALRGCPPSGAHAARPAPAWDRRGGRHSPPSAHTNIPSLSSPWRTGIRTTAPAVNFSRAGVSAAQAPKCHCRSAAPWGWGLRCPPGPSCSPGTRPWGQERLGWCCTGRCLCGFGRMPPPSSPWLSWPGARSKLQTHGAGERGGAGHAGGRATILFPEAGAEFLRLQRGQGADARLSPRFQRHVHTYRILPDDEGLLSVQVGGRGPGAPRAPSGSRCGGAGRFAAASSFFFCRAPGEVEPAAPRAQRAVRFAFCTSWLQRGTTGCASFAQTLSAARPGCERCRSGSLAAAACRCCTWGSFAKYFPPSCRCHRPGRESGQSIPCCPPTPAQPCSPARCWLGLVVPLWRPFMVSPGS